MNAKSKRRKLTGIKYCGGCNPHIDRTKLVQKISKLLPPEYIFTTKQSSPWDIGILVCGCPNACVDKPELKNLARQWIVVAGNSVDLNNVPEEKLAAIVARKIKRD
jgi:3-hydroxyacyl-[acyl-carrier-protein] dehydratase